MKVRVGEGWVWGGRGGAVGVQAAKTWIQLKKKKAIEHFQCLKRKTSSGQAPSENCSQTVCFVLSFKEQVDAQSAGDDEDDEDDADHLVRS